MKYRKKPVVIEAFQVQPLLAETEFVPWFQDAIAKDTVRWSTSTSCYYIETLEGVMQAVVGDWIIQGVKGEIYPCKDDIFQATYEKV